MNVAGSLPPLGVVVIGRNEGERLARCLDSLADHCDAIVYVDSGSTDESVALAEKRGARVVILDRESKFTAARARNAGERALRALAPEAQFIQFVDGDCEVEEGWIQVGQRALQERADVAVVCGRRLERNPEESIYNLLCHLEWNTPVGETEASGGDAMMRLDAFREVGGFEESLIAGEEPELCLRLRQSGWKILRVECDMTRHDAEMHRFGQWWRRAQRAGHAFAEVSWRHRTSSLRIWQRESRSIWCWGAVWPLVTLTAIVMTAWGFLLLLPYGILMVRVFLRGRGSTGPRHALLYSWFCVIGKFPQALGQLQFHVERLRGRASTLIEYK